MKELEYVNATVEELVRRVPLEVVKGLAASAARSQFKSILRGEAFGSEGTTRGHIDATHVRDKYDAGEVSEEEMLAVRDLFTHPTYASNMIFLLLTPPRAEHKEDDYKRMTTKILRYASRIETGVVDYVNMGHNPLDRGHGSLSPSYADMRWKSWIRDRYKNYRFNNPPTTQEDPNDE